MRKLAALVIALAACGESRKPSPSTQETTVARRGDSLPQPSGGSAADETPAPYPPPPNGNPAIAPAGPGAATPGPVETPSPAAAAGAQLVVTGQPEVVYLWSRDKCDAKDFIDGPARAFRDANGSVQLIGGMSVNRRFIGPDLDHLKHPCEVILASPEDANPASFADSEWLNALYTPDGKTIYALLHIEYHGWQHPGQCPAGSKQGDGPCWYAASGLAVSHDGGKSFKHASGPTHVIASLPYRYEPGMGGKSGVGMADPIGLVEKDGYFYFMAVSRNAHKNFPDGVALFRSKNLDDPTSWRAWDGKDFAGRFTNPYSAEAAGEATLFQPLFPTDHGRGMVPKSLTYNTYLKKYLLIGHGFAPFGAKPRPFGFVYAVSDDLIHWSEPQVFMETPQVEDPARGKKWRTAMYPSAIDPASTDRNFSTTGKKFYVYYSKINGTPGPTWFDRDIARVPVELK